MRNHLKWIKIYGLSYVPPQLCKLPLKIFSPFLTRISKKARTDLTLNWIPVPLTCRQSVRIMR